LRIKGVSDRDKAVIEVMQMQMKNDKALEYVKASGFEMSLRTLYRIKKQVKKRTNERLYLIAAQTFAQQHLERIDELELIKKLMWENYHLEFGSPYRKVMILKEIKDIQRYISSYYEATPDYIEKPKPEVDTRSVQSGE